MTAPSWPTLSASTHLEHVATEVAVLAAEFVRSNVGRARTAATKSSPTDVVTPHRSRLGAAHPCGVDQQVSGLVHPRRGAEGGRRRERDRLDRRPDRRDGQLPLRPSGRECQHCGSDRRHCRCGSRRRRSPRRRVLGARRWPFPPQRRDHLHHRAAGPSSRPGRNRLQLRRRPTARAGRSAEPNCCRPVATSGVWARRRSTCAGWRAAASMPTSNRTPSSTTMRPAT